jgi:subtilase family serine protease
VTIPIGTLTGTYYVIAKADGDEVIAEVNESNNAKSSGLIKIGPDLVVSAVAVPFTAGAGKSISITDTTKNNSAGDADPTTTSFYLSTDSTLDSNDVFLGSRAAGSLAAGATNQGTTSVTIPESTASGAYYIIAKADAGNTVPEINEDNNTYFKTVTIGPDLAVSSLTAPSTAGAGKNIIITETTKNNGPGDVGASTTIFYLSTDTTVDANDALLGSRSVSALTAGTSSAGSTAVTIPAGIASGMYYIIAQADGGTVVREINENNNTFSRSINIGLDLVVSAVTAPSTAGAGTSISITDTTKNNGPGDIGTSATGIYLSTDSMLDGSDLLLGSRAVPDLVAGATNAGTTAVTIPAGTTAGTYYIIIKADKDDAIAELNEYNNTLLKTVAVK